MRKYQYYIIGDDGDRDGYAVNWIAQTFTPGANHMISKVKLKLFRVGDPSTIQVSIKNTTAGKPSGADLCSGTIEGTDLTTNTNGEWYEITLGDGYTVTKDVQYAIVVKATAGDASNRVSWRADLTSPAYTGGSNCLSSDSGVDWAIYSGVDCMFEEWGTGPPSPTTITWGNLFKSQISTEKVEEAIARIIQNHEDDPDSHIEIGESLQSHKAAEVIDHIVESIINDKIKRGEITLPKLSMTQHQLFSVFESLDGWTKSPFGVEARIFGAALQTTSTINTEKILTADPFGDVNALDFTKNPFFQTSIRIDSDRDNIVYIMAGSVNLDGTDNSFGFKAIGDETWAIHIKSDGMTQVEYTTPVFFWPIGEWNILRAEFDSAAGEIKFWIDGKLEATHNSNLPEDGNPTIMAYYIKNTIALNKALYVRDLLWSKDV